MRCGQSRPLFGTSLSNSAIVVIDEQGKYCISLMSGHMGGANEFAQDFASQLDAQPIITTATDLNQKFAVDLFAKRNQLFLTDRSLAKEISAALLAGQPVCFQSEFPFEGKLPEGLVSESGETNFKIQVGFSVPTQGEHSLADSEKSGFGNRMQKRNRKTGDRTDGFAYAAIPLFTDRIRIGSSVD